MVGLNPTEARLVRKCATLLRVADSLDRSHRQPISKLVASLAGSKVQVRLTSRTPIDLERWDVEHELPLFREVFGKSLALQQGR